MTSVLAGVHADWLEIFEKPHIREMLTELLPMADQSTFEAFRHSSIGNLRLVIVGQSPVGTTGLAFDRKRVLKSIAACLFRCRMIPKPALIDLRSWAVQGVLLLNRALTKESASAWHPFTTAIVAELCELPVTFMLWGNNARRLQTHIQSRPCMLWGHPSPSVDALAPEDERFINCDHFTRVELPGRAIVWDSYADVTMFADGACSGNGKASARAGYGVFICGGAFDALELHGPVAPWNYLLVNDVIVSGDVAVRPSNNRAEFLAACHALQTALNSYTYGAVKLITDCKLFCNTLTVWLPGWKRNGTMEGKANLDLIAIAEELYTRLQARCQSVTIKHVNASHDYALPADACDEARFIWRGNDKADKLARAGVPQLG